MSRADLVTLGTERENATAPGCPAGATAWEGRWPLGGRGGFSAAPTQPWELCLGKRLLLSRQQTECEVPKARTPHSENSGRRGAGWGRQGDGVALRAWGAPVTASAALLKTDRAGWGGAAGPAGMRSADAEERTPGTTERAAGKGGGADGPMAGPSESANGWKPARVWRRRGARPG